MSAEGRQIAAVDLGSNSFHLKVARVDEHGRLQVVDRLREMVRLAAGLDPFSGRLSEESQARALACLARFAQRLRGLPTEAVRVVGTNTLRQASNAATFIAKAEEVLGHEIEIVSGREEARLIYLGVAASVSGDERRLVIDIGGGSTEVIVGEGSRPLERESLHMGCVSWTRDHLSEGPLTAKTWRRAVLAARAQLEPVEARFRALGWERVLGASGTVRAVAKILQALGGEPGRITLAGLEALGGRLLREGVSGLPALDPARAPVLPGGLAVLTALFQGLGLKAMEVADGALREGLLLDLVGRIYLHEDVRDATIEDLQRRYHVDREQAARVAETALILWERTAPALKIDAPRWRQELAWAARSHEIGMDIAHNQYHKHGAYILENADLAGFSRQEQRRLALLVRLHRRKFALGTLEVLADKKERRAVQRLALLLRLAVLLHRGRTPLSLDLEQCRVEADKGRLAIHFPPGWLEAHPLTQADLEQEVAYLAAAEWELVFS